MGREAFIKRVWEWKAESGGTIISQLKRLGASCDWSRERFTMDEGLSRAVMKVFVTLYREGLIYKDKRLVNWDPKLKTAISDLEVQQVETKGHLWYIKYPIEGSDEFIVVATTRPETMLGDVAVAVHPENERLKHLIGKHAILPLVGRRIPIIADDYADPEKGSGAVKITPAHDFNDFEVGKRHDLPLINMFDRRSSSDAQRTISSSWQTHISELALLDALDGKSREARARLIVEQLEAAGPDREDRADEPRRSAWRPLRRGARTVSDRSMVRRRQDAGGARDQSGARRATPNSCRSSGKRPSSTGWKTSSRGAFPGKFGGAIRFRPGTARMARHSSSSALREADEAVRRRSASKQLHRRMRRRSTRRRRSTTLQSILRSGRALRSREGSEYLHLARSRTCSTPGSLRRCGRSRRWAGRTRRRSSSASIRPRR